jgi:hypothetical protein
MEKELKARAIGVQEEIREVLFNECRVAAM